MPGIPSLHAPPIHVVDCELLKQREVLLRVLRLDLIHPHLHGNKWFKLKYNVQYVSQRPIAAVLSFGGAYSNHLYALAAAGKQFGFKTIGVVRGELVQPLNPVLQFAQEQGMALFSVSRQQYRQRAEAGFIADLRGRFGHFYLLPEGGSNALALAGCAEIAELIQWQRNGVPRFVGLACGTGTTMAGLLQGLNTKGTIRGEAPQGEANVEVKGEAIAEAKGPVAAGSEQSNQPTVLGTAVLKAPGYIQQELARWLPQGSSVPWCVLEDYHAGGYARSNAELLQFMTEFKNYSDIPIEPVYTGKLMFSLLDQVRKGAIPAGSEILALHCGGIF